MTIAVDLGRKATKQTKKQTILFEKSYNKLDIDFNFGRLEDLSTLKSDIYLGLSALVNYHFFG